MQDTSVIIPTLQRGAELHDLIRMFDAHPRVREILIVNNVATPISNLPEKARVLQQESNIYVNPAWNLGCAEASGTFLILANDDISFDPEIIDYALDLIERGRYTLLGVDRSFVAPRDRSKPKVRPAQMVHVGFGVLMFMPKSTYFPIPGEALIFAGDDWLFWHQPKIPGSIFGFPIRTRMGTSSGNPAFERIALSDRDWWHDKAYPEIHGSRRWHTLVPVITRFFAFNRKAKALAHAMSRKRR